MEKRNDNHAVGWRCFNSRNVFVHVAYFRLCGWPYAMVSIKIFSFLSLRTIFFRYDVKCYTSGFHTFCFVQTFNLFSSLFFILNSKLIQRAKHLPTKAQVTWTTIFLKERSNKLIDFSSTHIHTQTSANHDASLCEIHIITRYRLN